MSDDLIERLEKGVRRSDRKAADNTRAERALAHEAAARIRELESACYRLTEERDRLKGWADKYHDEVLELREKLDVWMSSEHATSYRMRELESRLATAEADALERAAKEVDCGCNGWCMDPVNCSREDAEAIRSLKPKTSE